MDFLAQQKPLKDLCERFRVERLYLFGSAAQGDFHFANSDLDFLVTLAPQPAGEYAENYLALAHALEELFQRRVDLVTESSIRNRYFREAVTAQRQLLYDRRDEKAVA
jgi:predicted nucleotidyltransferase